MLKLKSFNVQFMEISCVGFRKSKKNRLFESRFNRLSKIDIKRSLVHHLSNATKKEHILLKNRHVVVIYSDGKSIDTYRYISLVSISISIPKIAYFFYNSSVVFPKIDGKNSTKFPSKCLKICTKGLCISPQISLKFQETFQNFFTS